MLHEKGLFVVIKILIGFVIFAALYFLYVQLNYPGGDWQADAARILALFFTALIADLGGWLVAATLYPRGKTFSHRVNAWTQRVITWMLQAVVTAFGLMILLAEEVFGDSLLDLLFAWVLIRFVCYLLAFWLARVFF